MAESFPTLPALPPEYAEHITNLRSQYEGSLGEIQYKEEGATRNEQEGMSNLLKAEPGEERRLAGSMGARGLTQSGINARAIGLQKAGFLQKEGALTKKLASERENFQNQRRIARGNLAKNEGTYITGGEKAFREENEKNPPLPKTGESTYPTPPVATAAVAGGAKAGAGGVVPYTSGGKGKGFVRVGPGLPTSAYKFTGPPGPGGVAPYETRGGKGTFIRVGPRRAAARKAFRR